MTTEVHTQHEYDDLRGVADAARAVKTGSSSSGWSDLESATKWFGITDKAVTAAGFPNLRAWEISASYGVNVGPAPDVAAAAYARAYVDGAEWDALTQVYDASCDFLHGGTFADLHEAVAHLDTIVPPTP